MEDFEQQVIDELNTIRTSPQEYSKIIRGNIKNFKGLLLHLPGQNWEYRLKKEQKPMKKQQNILRDKKE